MRTYNLAESATLLGVDPATLRRWRAAAGGAGVRGAADRRRVWLSRVELIRLACAHGRVLLDAVRGGDVEELEGELADLSARVTALECIVCARGYTG